MNPFYRPSHCIRRLLPLVALACLAIPARAAKSKATAGLKPDGLADLGAPQITEVLRALDSVGIPLASAEGATWKRRKGTYLVLAVDAAGQPDTTRFRLFAFDLSAAKPRFLAASEAVELDPDETLGSFDFAAYKIRPGEFAFGVTYSRRRSYAGGSATLDAMTLYRMQGASIAPILGAATAYEADLAGEWNEDGTRDRAGGSGSAVLIVTAKQTRGFFDILLKADTGKTARFRWNGDGYDLEGEDPFPTGEYEIFGER